MFCLPISFLNTTCEQNCTNCCERIYFSPLNPASFTGDPKKLYQTARLKLPSLTEKQVIKWLHQQHTYQLHKSSPNRRSVQYAQVVVPGPNHQLDIDLMYVTKIKNYNRGYNYLLVVVDVFSRKAYVAPLKVKTATCHLRSIHGVSLTGNCPLEPPKVVRTDRGKEFEGCFDRFLREHKFQHYWATGKHKANYAERFIRTLRAKLLRYLTHQYSYRYIDALPELIQSYNNTYHRSIGMTPNEVTEKTAIALRNRLYGTKKSEASEITPILLTWKIKYAFYVMTSLPLPKMLHNNGLKSTLKSMLNWTGHLSHFY